jgi:hypothetical protein
MGGLRAFWLLFFPFAAACTGSDENLSGIDAGSPDADAASVTDATTLTDRSVSDRVPILDLDALRPWDANSPDPGDEPKPPPEPCDPDAGAGEPPDTNDDIYGIDGCRPMPARLIVLGDSIATSFGADSPLTMKLREFVPSLAFELHAEAGSQMVHLPAQARRAAPGPGHVFVFIWSIGNDLGVGLLEPNADLTARQTAFAETLGYFSDSGRFPGGVTFLLNTQYVTRDNCDAPGALPGRNPEVVQRLLDLNEIFFLDVAEARPDTVAIDHYPDFLGHGANANIKGCPYCGRDNTQWTDRLGIHPNGAGTAHIAEKWEIAFAAMLGPSCRDL